MQCKIPSWASCVGLQPTIMGLQPTIMGLLPTFMGLHESTMLWLHSTINRLVSTSILGIGDIVAPLLKTWKHNRFMDDMKLEFIL